MRCTPSHLVRPIFVFVVTGVKPYTIGDRRGLEFITNSALQIPTLSLGSIQLSLYKWYSIALLALFVLQTILIAKLLLERKRHWRVSSRLNESEERFSKAFRGNPQPMSITTIEEGRYVDVNASFLMMSGYTRQEIIDHTSIELQIFKTEEERHKLLVEPLLT